MRLILASASPRRAELLTAAGIAFDILPADVDESIAPGESPADHVTRLALAKAAAVVDTAPGRPVLAADTVVVVSGEILGKPRDASDARRMLRLLSGAWHEVMTGVCLAGIPLEPEVTEIRLTPDPVTVGLTPDAHTVRLEPAPAAGGSPAGTGSARFADVRVEITAVQFALLSPEEIEWYVGTGEPMDKAGAYAVQGLASRFVTRLEGSYSNVVGLPVALVYEMCRRGGLLLS